MITKTTRNSIYFLYKKWIKKLDPIAICKDLASYDRLSIEEKNSHRTNNLLHILRAAATQTPYYRMVFNEMNLRFNEQEDLKQFQSIPILDKRKIRKNFNFIKNINLEKIWWNVDTTSGSTGDPMVFISDHEFNNRKQGLKEYEFLVNGRTAEDTLCVLWGFDHGGPNKKNGGIAHRISCWLRNRIELDAVILNEEIMARYAAIIQSKKTVVIQAYSHAIYEFARFINQKNYRFTNVKFVITSASSLYEFMRKEIEKAFGCKVYNRYGSREFGIVAFQKRMEPDLVVNASEYLVEVLNENGDHCQPGQEGEVVITSYYNHAFPFIRYKTGDLAVAGKISAYPVRSCLTLRNVTGRVGDSLVRKDGSLISSHHLPHKIRKLIKANWLENLQIVQHSFEEVTINLVPTGYVHISEDTIYAD